MVDPELRSIVERDLEDLSAAIASASPLLHLLERLEPLLVDERREATIKATLTGTFAISALTR
jgi:hypothetical protein